MPVDGAGAGAPTRPVSTGSGAGGTRIGGCWVIVAAGRFVVSTFVVSTTGLPGIGRLVWGGAFGNTSGLFGPLKISGARTFEVVPGDSAGLDATVLLEDAAVSRGALVSAGVFGNAGNKGENSPGVTRCCT